MNIDDRCRGNGAAADADSDRRRATRACSGGPVSEHHWRQTDRLTGSHVPMSRANRRTYGRRVDDNLSVSQSKQTRQQLVQQDHSDSSRGEF